jgi:hypothetical protein
LERGTVQFGEIRIDRHSGNRIVESWWIPYRMTLRHQLVCCQKADTVPEFHAVGQPSGLEDIALEQKRHDERLTMYGQSR